MPFHRRFPVISKTVLTLFQKTIFHRLQFSVSEDDRFKMLCSYFFVKVGLRFVYSSAYVAMAFARIAARLPALVAANSLCPRSARTFNTARRLLAPEKDVTKFIGKWVEEKKENFDQVADAAGGLSCPSARRIVCQCFLLYYYTSLILSH